MTLSPIGELVRRHDSDRFLASLFAPAALREVVLVLCAFNHELARAREVTREPMLALIRLHWWREVVEGARRRHEVAGPLGDLIDRGAVMPADLLAMIDAREMEAEASIPDMLSWLAYLRGAFGGISVAIGRALGASNVELVRLRELGAFYGAAGSVLGVEILARSGRCLLPEDVLGAHGVTRDHVVRDPACARPVLVSLAAEAQGLLRGGAGRFPAAVVAAGLPAVLAKRDLHRLERRRGLFDRLAVVRSGLLGRIA